MKISIIYFIAFCTLVRGFFLSYKYKNLIYQDVRRHLKPASENSVFQQNNFAQKLDHYDPTNRETWTQKYWVSRENYDGKGLVFLFIEGESPGDPRIAQGTSWAEYSRKYHSMVFVVEHRFYGKSQPKQPLTTANLKYLSTEQALADLAHFIEKMNQQYKLGADTKWIAFGASYAGSLAAWLRMKYPHLVHAAYSSSAPLLAQADFPEYLQIVETALKSYKKQCVAVIRRATRRLEQLVKTERGQKKIKTTFNLCDDFKNKDDIATFFQSLADLFSFVVQYNHEIFRPNIKKTCDILTKRDKKKNAIQKYAEVTSNMLQSKCLSVSYEEMIKEFNSTDDGPNSYMRAWIYQTCTEYGFYQTSSKPTDLFGKHFPISTYIKLCEDIYDKKFINKELLYDGVQRTNRFFGDKTLNVTNILFVHGSHDPWHSLGVISDNKKAYKTVLLKGTSHCTDIWLDYLPRTTEFNDARNKIKQTMDSWMT